MINNPQMREVPNGCITIDAQPCGLVTRGESPYRSADIRHYSGEASPEPFSYALEQLSEGAKE